MNRFEQYLPENKIEEYHQKKPMQKRGSRYEPHSQPYWVDHNDPTQTRAGKREKPFSHTSLKEAEDHEPKPINTVSSIAEEGRMSQQDEEPTAQAEIKFLDPAVDIIDRKPNFNPEKKKVHRRALKLKEFIEKRNRFLEKAAGAENLQPGEEQNVAAGGSDEDDSDERKRKIEERRRKQAEIADEEFELEEEMYASDEQNSSNEGDQQPAGKDKAGKSRESPYEFKQSDQTPSDEKSTPSKEKKSSEGQKSSSIENNSDNRRSSDEMKNSNENTPPGQAEAKASLQEEGDHKKLENKDSSSVPQIEATAEVQGPGELLMKDEKTGESGS